MKLNHLKLRQIHQVIIATDSIRDAAKMLNVMGKTLTIRLTKLGTNYTELKKLTEIEAAAKFVNYDQLVKTTKVNLNNFTLRRIHQAILTTDVIANAAANLGVNDKTLKAHLAKLGTDYKTLKNLSVADAANRFEFYNQIVNTKKVDLNSLTLRQIHQVIITTDNIANAAGYLGVYANILQHHLTRLGTDYAALKNLTEIEAAAKFEDYDQLVQTTEANLNNLTLRQIHQVIIVTDNIYNAAVNLHVSKMTLQIHLAKLSTNYEVLKTLTEAAAVYRFDYYDEIVKTKKVNLNNLTLSQIHQIIIASNSSSDAAAHLGVTERTLRIHLVKLGTNYEELKSLTETDAANRFEFYDQIGKTEKVDLNNFTLKEIHQIIIATVNVTNAAANLGVDERTLKSHLAKLGTSYDVLKDLTEEDAANRFEFYDQIVKTKIVDLNNFTLRRIHQTILATDDISNAAANLGVGVIKLKVHLTKLGIIYTDLKILTEEDAANRFEFYDQIVKTKKVDLNKLTLRQMHQAIIVTTDILNAAAHLGVRGTTLKAHLTKYGTNYEELKTLTESAANMQFENYDQIVKKIIVKLDSLSLRQIHQAILATNDISNAAVNLGVTSRTLKKHLAKINTSYAALKKLTEIEAAIKFKNYDQIILDTNHKKRKEILYSAETSKFNKKTKSQTTTDVVPSLSKDEIREESNELEDEMNEAEIEEGLNSIQRLFTPASPTFFRPSSPSSMENLFPAPEDLPSVFLNFVKK